MYICVVATVYLQDLSGIGYTIMIDIQRFPAQVRESFEEIITMMKISERCLGKTCSQV